MGWFRKQNNPGREYSRNCWKRGKAGRKAWHLEKKRAKKCYDRRHAKFRYIDIILALGKKKVSSDKYKSASSCI
jgi:hypothetical protein